MVKYAKCFVALCFSLAVLLVYAAPSNAQQNPVTAIDSALEPDATMIQHAQADNARLLKAFPKGFAGRNAPSARLDVAAVCPHG